MPTVEFTTRVDAPVERVFDLARTVDVQRRSAGVVDEEAVAGVTTGLLGDGDRVTWRARHFGLPFERTTEMTGYDRPRWFRDEQRDGPFAEMVHDHRFGRARGVTEMTDEFTFSVPYGLVGTLVGRLFVESYVEWLLRERAARVTEIAESGDEWRAYLETGSS